MLKITCKLPLSDDLAEALRSMPDADAGAAFKAVLAYMAGSEAPVLPPGAKLAFVAMRSLVDLSRARTRSGKSGSAAGGRSTRFVQGKTDFAGNTAPGKPVLSPSAAESADTQALPPPEGFDVLSGLDAFL